MTDQLNFSFLNLPVLRNTQPSMADLPHFISNSNLNELKQEILEKESELDTAKQNAEIALKVLLDKTKDFNQLEENLLKIPENLKTGPSFNILLSMRTVMKDKIPDASSRYSKASQIEWKASKELKKAKLALNQIKSSQGGTQKTSHYQDPEDYEKQIFQNVLKNAEKGSKFLKKAHQEKLAIYQDEKHYEILAEIIDGKIQDGDLKDNPMITEAIDALHKLRDENDARAEYFLEMKKKALEAYSKALKSKEMLSPENRKLILQELQHLIPSMKSNQTQMTTPKRKILPRRKVLSYQKPQNFVQSPKKQIVSSPQHKVLPHRRVRVIAPVKSIGTLSSGMAQKSQVKVSPGI